MMPFSLLRHFLLPAALLLASLLQAETLSGTVVGVHDGDTITVLTADHRQEKIRLDAIDAPELHQDWGSQAKQALSAKVFGKPATVEYTQHDRYGRIIGKILCNGRDINLEMVKDGMAWHYKQYNKEAVFARAETDARAARLGLWAGKTPVAPWDFRRDTKPATAPPKAAGTSQPKPAMPIAKPAGSTAAAAGFWLSGTGTRHRPGCRYYGTGTGHACGPAEGTACKICGG
jgi:endonuclease YncB( thermonuclease family)